MARIPAVPHAQKKAPHRKVFSKWPESKGAAAAHERTQGAHVLALEGREAAAIDPA